MSEPSKEDLTMFMSNHQSRDVDAAIRQLARRLSEMEQRANVIEKAILDLGEAQAKAIRTLAVAVRSAGDAQKRSQG